MKKRKQKCAYQSRTSTNSYLSLPQWLLYFSWKTVHKFILSSQVKLFRQPLARLLGNGHSITSRLHSRKPLLDNNLKAKEVQLLYCPRFAFLRRKDIHSVDSFSYPTPQECDLCSCTGTQASCAVQEFNSYQALAGLPRRQWKNEFHSKKITSSTCLSNLLPGNAFLRPQAQQETYNSYKMKLIVIIVIIVISIMITHY